MKCYEAVNKTWIETVTGDWVGVFFFFRERERVNVVGVMQTLEVVHSVKTVRD